WFKSWDYDCSRFPVLHVTTSDALALKPNMPGAPVPNIGAPNIGAEPVVIEAAPKVPPPAQNFDPLEHENKLNEPAPELHQDHLNSNAAMLDSEMKKKATTVEPAAKSD
ncbi:hypothetical protein H4S07_005106, partial [Coemansia furcata]